MAAVFLAAVNAPAADRTILAIFAHAGDAEGFSPYLYVDVSEDLAAWKAAVTSYEFVRGGISSFPCLEYHESLARVRGAVAGKRFAVALDVDPFSKKHVTDALP